MAQETRMRLPVFTITVILSILFTCAGVLPARSEGPTTEAKQTAPVPWTKDHIRKRPYLVYSGKSTGMTVLWQTYQTPARATVEWGTTTSYGKGPVVVHENGRSSDQHQFEYTIPQLTPGTKYYYRVTNDAYSHTGSFIAAPPSGQTSLSFYGYGDTRPVYVDPPVDHNLVLTELLTDMNVNPTARQTLLVHLGDYVWNGLNEFLWDLQMHNPDPAYDAMHNTFANLPFMGVLGNHEGYDANANGDQKNELNYENIGELFRKYYPYQYPKQNRFYHSFDYGPVHFVIIDTWSYQGASNTQQTIDTAQVNWLKQDLKASRKPWKIAMLHTPIWECLQGVAAMQDQLTPILKEGGVHLVLQGHHHYYSRAETEGPYAGMTYVTLGGGGAALGDEEVCVQETNKVWPTVAIWKTFHFARFDIAGDTLTGTVIDPSGNTIDTFQVTNN